MYNPYGFAQPSLGNSIVAGDHPLPSVLDTAGMRIKRGGMFGGKDIGTAISAALNGYLAAGGNPAGIAGLQQLHQQTIDEQNYQRERADRRDDFVFQQDYHASHPGPVNNDTVNDYQFILQQLGPEKAREYLETKANPPQFMQVPGVGIVQIPRAGGDSAPPPGPVGNLKPYNPGGPTPQASGGFPY